MLSPSREYWQCVLSMQTPRGPSKVRTESPTVGKRQFRWSPTLFDLLNFGKEFAAKILMVIPAKQGVPTVQKAETPQAEKATERKMDKQRRVVGFLSLRTHKAADPFARLYHICWTADPRVWCGVGRASYPSGNQYPYGLPTLDTQSGPLGLALKPQTPRKITNTLNTLISDK